MFTRDGGCAMATDGRLAGTVTDVGIEAVAKKCPSLTNVVLSSFCGKVTDAAIEALA